MNNSFLAIENASLAEKTEERKPFLREREGKLITIIDAIQKTMVTKEWSSLREEVFDALPDVLEREISVEAKKLNPDVLKLRFVAGQLKWAEKFSDLKKLENEYRVELANVRKLLYGTTEKES